MKLRKKENKKVIGIFLFSYFLIFLFLFSFNFALAQGINPPKLQVDITGFAGFGDSSLPGGSTGNLQVDWIGQYVGALYRFGVSAAVILAVVVIMVGGFLWLTSGGSPNRVGRAKDLIISAMSGLLLALFSFIILQGVNPRLVSLDPISVGQVDRIDIALAPERDIGQGRGVADSVYNTSGDGERYTQLNEGYRTTVYRDSLGNLTVGYGHLVTPGDGLSFGDQITAAQAEQFFQQDYNRATQDAINFVGGTDNWERLSSDRQTVLIDMAFNLGGSGLGSFTQLQGAVLDGINSNSSSAWEAASFEILNSVYATQVPNRARRNALIMAAGFMSGLLQ